MTGLAEHNAAPVFKSALKIIGQALLIGIVPSLAGGLLWFMFIPELDAVAMGVGFGGVLGASGLLVFLGIHLARGLKKTRTHLEKTRHERARDAARAQVELLSLNTHDLHASTETIEETPPATEEPTEPSDLPAPSVFHAVSWGIFLGLCASLALDLFVLAMCYTFIPGEFSADGGVAYIVFLFLQMIVYPPLMIPLCSILIYRGRQSLYREARGSTKPSP